MLSKKSQTTKEGSGIINQLQSLKQRSSKRATLVIRVKYSQKGLRYLATLMIVEAMVRLKLSKNIGEDLKNIQLDLPKAKIGDENRKIGNK